MKKNVRLIFGLIGGMAILTSCVDGVLKVNTSMELKDKKNRAVVFSGGTYNATLDIGKPLFSKNKKLTINVKGKKKVSFKIPRGMYLPSNHGEFELSSKESGQPVDILATLDTHYSRTPTKSKIQNCSKIRYYKKCVRTEDNRNRVVTKSIYLQGDQVVVYHYDLTKKYIRATLYGLEGQNKGTFSGSSSNSTYVEESASPCRLYREERRRFRELERVGAICPRLDRVPGKGGSGGKNKSGKKKGKH